MLDGVAASLSMFDIWSPAHHILCLFANPLRYELAPLPPLLGPATAFSLLPSFEGVLGACMVLETATGAPALRFEGVAGGDIVDEKLLGGAAD